MRSRARVIFVALFLCVALSAQDSPHQPPAPPAFDQQTASRLLLQLSESLQGHSQRQFFALFDLARMKDGALFRQQASSFFTQTESIRVHLNLVDTSVDGDTASIAVDAEMEAEPRNGGPVARRNEQLNFVVANAGNSWKFTDVQPRTFFSLP